MSDVRTQNTLKVKTKMRYEQLKFECYEVCQEKITYRYSFMVFNFCLTLVLSKLSAAGPISFSFFFVLF